MNSKENILTKIHRVEGGNIFEISINRPDVHNCVNGDTADLLLKAWQTFRNDESLSVAIFRGVGDKSFCAGADLSALESLIDMDANVHKQQNWVKNGTGPMGGTRLIQEKPVITVSQGYTYAGGLELFCHGHIRIAEKQAMFSVACRRWGVPLADGGTAYLPWLIGNGNALPLILTGQRIRAKRAFEIGLVWEVTSKGEGLKRAFEYAKQLCKFPRDAMQADLISVMRGSRLPLSESLEIEAQGLYSVFNSESIRNGVKRFIDGTRFWFK